MHTTILRIPHRISRTCTIESCVYEVFVTNQAWFLEPAGFCKESGAASCSHTYMAEWPNLSAPRSLFSTAFWDPAKPRALGFSSSPFLQGQNQNASEVRFAGPEPPQLTGVQTTTKDLPCAKAPDFARTSHHCCTSLESSCFRRLSQCVSLITSALANQNQCMWSQYLKQVDSSKVWLCKKAFQGLNIYPQALVFTAHRQSTT